MEVIDRNLRQRFLPFVLNGKSPYPNDHGASWIPQLFSYRTKDTTRNGYLNIIPSDRFLFNTDIGIKLQANVVSK